MRDTTLENGAKLSDGLRCACCRQVVKDRSGGKGWVHCVAGLLPNQRSKLLWHEIEDVEQEIVQSDPDISTG